MKKTMVTKSQKLCISLKEKIKSGLYAPGVQLPSCRQLAEDNGISYVTAAQCLKRLVEEGLAVNCRNKGIFIPQKASRRVKLVCTHIGGPDGIAFLTEGVRIFSEAGWTVKSIIDPTTTLDELLEPEWFIVFFGLSGKLCTEIENRHAQKRVVALGSQRQESGIASVISDETQLARLAMNTFLDSGCKRPALMITSITQSVDQLRRAAWQNILTARNFAEKEMDGLLFDLNLEHNSGTSEVDATLHYMEKLESEGRLRSFDAILTPGFSSAIVVQAFLLERGFRIPEDVSIINIGEVNYLRFLHPSVTVVDPDVTRHLKIALQIQEDRIDGREQVLVHLCEPRLIIRNSTRAFETRRA